MIQSGSYLYLRIVQGLFVINSVITVFSALPVSAIIPGDVQYAPSEEIKKFNISFNKVYRETYKGRELEVVRGRTGTPPYQTWYPINIDTGEKLIYSSQGTKMDIYKYSNVFVSSRNYIIARDNSVYMQGYFCREFVPERDKNKTFTVDFQNEDEVICYNHDYTGFGHFFPEMVHPLLQLDESIRRRAKYIIPSCTPLIYDLLDTADIPRENIICKDAVYGVKTLYTFETSPCLTYNGFLTNEYKDRLFERFNLTRKPFRYALYNRMNTTTRYIANFDDAVAKIREMHPEINWEIVPEDMDIKEAMKYFSEVKFFFSIHTSKLANILLMNRGTKVLSRIFFAAVQTQRNRFVH